MTTVASTDEKRVQVSFRTPESRRNQIRIEAAKDGLNPNEWIEKLVSGELQKRAQDQAAQ